MIRFCLCYPLLCLGEQSAHQQGTRTSKITF